MFTGIVSDIGRVQALEARGGDVRLVIAAQRLDLSAARVGDSICVQGCCLTATAVQARTFAADVSRETLALTTLGELQPDAAVNLEPALRAGDALGGHLVSGHVDGVSLTINAVQQVSFGVNIIPHTRSGTTLGSLRAGARVNLEVDQVARYLARLLALPAT